MNRTRAVQKLIETLKTPEQIGLAISSLRHGAVTLIKDLNGNHVVQRCLQRLSTEDSQVNANFVCFLFFLTIKCMASGGLFFSCIFWFYFHLCFYLY
jgi:hypothetical protein